jgi:hypothetical protein
MLLCHQKEIRKRSCSPAPFGKLLRGAGQV